MNKDFIIEDKTNNLQKKASGIVKFNYENKDYLIYCIDENEKNQQIFVSRLILNSEGKYFIDNIMPEEKNKLNNIVYNMVIVTPSNAKKGMDSNELIKNLTEKNMIKISCDIPELNIQEYYPNCSMAITNKEFVTEAIKFYETNLKEEKIEVNNQTPSWTLPIIKETKTESVVPEPTLSTPEVAPISVTPEVVPKPVVEPEVVMPTEPIVSVEVPTIEPVQEIKTEVIQPTTQEVNTNNIVSEPVITPKAEPSVNPVITEPVAQTIPSVSSPEQSVTVPIESNPQTAIVSDPSLTAAGVSMQQNAGQKNIGQQKAKTLTLKKAGFAINKYIIIGTLCILLSIAVVIVAYILIKKKTTGV